MYSSLPAIRLALGAFADLIFTRLSDDDLEAFITAADNLIDAYLVAVTGTLPLTPVPPLIANLSTAIAVRNLWAAKVAKDLPAHVKDDYDRSLRTLEMIAKGSLPIAAPDPESEDYNDLLSSATDRVFGDHL